MNQINQTASSLIINSPLQQKAKTIVLSLNNEDQLFIMLFFLKEAWGKVKKYFNNHSISLNLI
jgi:hypothetical protein